MAEPDVRTLEGLITSLTNQAPIDPEVVKVFEAIREQAYEFAEAIFNFVPEGRNRSMAITHLEDAVMRAIKGVALNQEEALTQWGAFWSADEHGGGSE